MTRLLPLLSFILIFASCTKGDDPISLSQSEQEYVNSFLVGTWEDVDNAGQYLRFTEDFIYSLYIERDGTNEYLKEPTYYTISECPWADKINITYRLLANGDKSTYMDFTVTSSPALYFYEMREGKLKVTSVYRKPNP